MFIPTNNNELTQVMKDIRERWDQIKDESPSIPQKFHDAALRIVKPDLSKQREE